MCIYIYTHTLRLQPEDLTKQLAELNGAVWTLRRRDGEVTKDFEAGICIIMYMYVYVYVYM